VLEGQYCAAGCVFISERLQEGAALNWHRLADVLAGSPVDVGINREGVVVVVRSPSSMRLLWKVVAHPHAGAREPATLPSYIVLPRDPSGATVLPTTRVTVLVEAREAWQREVGTLDATARAIVNGELVIPKSGLPLRRAIFRNHPSFDQDEMAKLALGPIIAKWLYCGVLEYVYPWDVQPLIISPCGAVPKATSPFYRLITDARFSNELYADWGVTYTSIAQL
jgi:hypothetical protein